MSLSMKTTSLCRKNSQPNDLCHAGRVIDEFAKEYLHDNLRWARESLLVKLEGLPEYDVRRPLTRTGTNLLGLVRHLSLSEARYLGEIVGRPYPESLPSFDDPGYANHDHMWVTEQVSRADVIDGYLRACRHADILREQLDGAVGDDPGAMDDGIDWEAHRARVERAARAAR